MNTGPQGARYGGAARPISSTHMASSAFKNQTEHESPSNPFMKRGREGIFFKDQVPFFFFFFLRTKHHLLPWPDWGIFGWVCSNRLCQFFQRQANHLRFLNPGATQQRQRKSDPDQAALGMGLRECFACFLKSVRFTRLSEEHFLRSSTESTWGERRYFT